MSVFTDSSALVKLYAEEIGHEVVRNIDVVVVSQIARVEVPAALWRKQRLGELSADQARVLTQEFEADFFGTDGDGPRFAAVLLAAEVLDRAARLCGVHGLRAYGALQLGSALLAREAESGCGAVAAFDTQLRRAAAAEGFALLPRD